MSEESEMQQCKNDLIRLDEELTNLQSPEESVLAELSREETPQMFNLKHRKTLKGHFGKIYALHWSSDSKKLVSASQDGKLNIWNGPSKNMLQTIRLTSSWVMTCAYSPDENLVASGGLDNTCTIYNLKDSDNKNKAKPRELHQHEGYLSCCRFLGNNKIITSSGDSTCIKWDLNVTMPENVYVGHAQDVMSLAVLDENTECFVSGSVDSFVKLWDMRVNCENRSIMTFRGHESDVNTVSWFPDGNAVVSGSDDNSCRLWDKRANKQLGIFANDKQLNPVTSCAFSNSGRFLFSGHDDSCMLVWDTKTGSLIGTTPFGPGSNGHERRVSCLGVSPDGKAIATGSWDQTLKIWA